MHEAQDSIVKEIDINAPVERVWGAITSAEHLATWFGDKGATIDFRVGGELSLTFEGHGTYWAVIEAIEPTTRFAWRWARMADAKPVPGEETLVEFNLREEGNMTRLRLVETGFISLAGGEAAQTSARDDNNGGWDFKLGELKQHTEAGAERAA